jgi:hypothetical protein
VSDRQRFDAGHLYTEYSEESIVDSIPISQVVAANAKRFNADATFSFDEWYRKIGLTLTDDLIEARKTGD